MFIHKKEKRGNNIIEWIFPFLVFCQGRPNSNSQFFSFFLPFFACPLKLKASKPPPAILFLFSHRMQNRARKSHRIALFKD